MNKEEALKALERIFNYCEEIDLHLLEGDPDRTGYNMVDDVNALRHYILFGEGGLKLSIPSGVYSSIPEACRHCNNHPSNGGSGICHCTLGGITTTC